MAMVPASRDTDNGINDIADLIREGSCIHPYSDHHSILQVTSALIPAIIFSHLSLYNVISSIMSSDPTLTPAEAQRAVMGRPTLQIRASSYRRPSLGAELRSPLSAISPLTSHGKHAMTPLRQVQLSFEDLEIGSPIDPVALSSPGQTVVSPSSGRNARRFSAFRGSLRSGSIDAVMHDIAFGESHMPH
jgi:hypothetical protein